MASNRAQVQVISKGGAISTAHCNELNWLDWWEEAGGSPAASDFLLFGQEKVHQREGHPLCRPCGVNLGRRLELGGSQTRTIRPVKLSGRPRAQTRSPQLPRIQPPGLDGTEGKTW